MPNMPDFVVQLEQASGLPWWCLLLLAVLALIVIVLAVSLGREKKRNRTGAVDIPRGAAAVSSDEATKVLEAAEEAPEQVATTEDAPAEEEPAADAAAQEEEPQAEAEEEAPAAPVATEAPEAEEPVQHDAEDAAAPDEPADEPAEAGEDAPQEDEVPAEPGKAPAEPDIEVLEGTPKASENLVDLSDDEILKATGGSHGRFGQSAFGIDFGFLEEYEAEYERALDEFQRLRRKNEQE